MQQTSQTVKKSKPGSMLEHEIDDPRASTLSLTAAKKLQSGGDMLP